MHTMFETHIIIYKMHTTHKIHTAAAAANLLQSCPTLGDPRDGSPSGSAIPGILQARTLEWVALSSSNAWKWKVKVNLLSPVWLFATPWTVAHQACPSMGFSRQEHWRGLPLPSPKYTLLYIKCTLLYIKQQPTPAFLPGESHGQRSLVGYSP